MSFKQFLKPNTVCWSVGTGELLALACRRSMAWRGLAEYYKFGRGNEPTAEFMKPAGLRHAYSIKPPRQSEPAPCQCVAVRPVFHITNSGRADLMLYRIPCRGR